MDDIPAAVAARPPVMRALEELVMLSQSELERERYEARRKAQLDYSTGLKAARLDGLEEGLAKGREEGRTEGEISRIQMCERLLKRPRTPSEQLSKLSLPELERMAGELEKELEVRNQ